jgi:acetoin utilization deacetylase AcuC-like enzyme
MMRLQPGDYGILASLLAGAADCSLALVLEGGYGPSLGAAVAAIFAGTSDPAVEIPTGEARRSTQELVSVLNKVRFV